jgi:hypothetical protein
MPFRGMLLPTRRGAPIHCTSYQEYPLPHWRHVPALMVSLLSLLSLGLAFNQATHPVSAIIETTGRVIDLARDPSSTSTSPRYQPVIQYQTTNGNVHTFTADFSQPASFLPQQYRVHIGDIVPIQYYPWAPAEASFGKVGKMIIMAIAVQWTLLLGSGVGGIIFIWSGGYLFARGRRTRAILHA